jgi:hypothetical protein
VVYVCEKYRSFLEHKEFCLHTDNQALAWLLGYAKELGWIGWWVLRLAPFKFNICHISGKTNVLVDCLTRQYEDLSADSTIMGLVSQHLPEAFQSIWTHQHKDLYYKVVWADPAARHKLLNDALVYHLSQAGVKHHCLPESLKPMLLQYFTG